MTATYSHSTVVTGTTGNEEKSPTSSDLADIILDTSEHHLVCVKVDSTSHCVHDRFWLLKDLLLHEGAEVSWNIEGKLFKHLQVYNLRSYEFWHIYTVQMRYFVLCYKIIPKLDFTKGISLANDFPFIYLCTMLKHMLLPRLNK